MSQELIHFKRPGSRQFIAHCGNGRQTVLVRSSYERDVTCLECLRLLERDRQMHEARIHVLKQTLAAKRWLRTRR